VPPPGGANLQSWVRVLSWATCLPVLVFSCCRPSKQPAPVPTQRPTWGALVTQLPDFESLECSVQWLLCDPYLKFFGAPSTSLPISKGRDDGWRIPFKVTESHRGGFSRVERGCEQREKGEARREATGTSRGAGSVVTLSPQLCPASHPALSSSALVGRAGQGAGSSGVFCGMTGVRLHPTFQSEPFQSSFPRDPEPQSPGDVWLEPMRALLDLRKDRGTSV
jgi:hypothetical protein